MTDYIVFTRIRTRDAIELALYKAAPTLMAGHTVKRTPSRAREVLERPCIEESPF